MSFLFLQLSQDLNKIKTEHPFVDVDKYENCEKIKQKLFSSMVAGARQSFQFFRKNICFLKNNKDLSKFLCEILHYLISVVKL